MRVRARVRARVRVISAAGTGARKGAVQVSATPREVHCCWKVAASKLKPGARVGVRGRGRGRMRGKGQGQR